MTAPRALLLLGLLAACAGKDGEGEDTADALSAPRIDHSPPVGTLVEGTPVELRATVSDPDGVALVDVVYHTVGVEFWDRKEMTLSEDGDYVATLGPYAPGLEYYIRATDTLGVEATAPVAAQADPYALSVLPATQTLPFIEDFELSDGQTSLFTMAWGTPSLAFNYYTWQLSTLDAASGAASAFHSRGAASAPEMDDWLISPPLDFTTLDSVQVTWQESGANTAGMGTHGLYVSTEGPDPASDAYVAVVEALDAPGREWGRSKVVDLTDWVGEPQVWVAWRYVGTYADDWGIDDVRVELRAPDLAATVTADSPVGPGDSLTVTWDLVNSTAAAGTGLSATMSLPEGGGTVLDPTQDVPDIAPLGEASVSYTVELDPDLVTNRYLPVELAVTDGTNDWTFSDAILIGQQSLALIDMSFETAGTIDVSLGVGDPAAPELEVPVELGNMLSPTASWSIDLTPWHTLLPPVAGENRWYLKVGSTSPGTVDRFQIEVGGELSGGVASTGPFSASTPAVFYVPPPPLPELTSLSPGSLAPGDTGVPLVLTIANRGTDSAGPVTATIVSDSPTLTITGGETVEVDADQWTAAEVLLLDAATLSVSAAHVDSRDVALHVELSDGADSWTVPASIPVPWPVIEVVGTEIRDDGRDGILDGGETADIELRLANAGDLPTNGRATVTASVAASSTVAATFLDDTDSISLLAPGQDADADFELVVDSGSAGDTLVLDLVIDDELRTYTSQLSLVLGEPPWQRIGNEPDDPGDLLGDSLDFTYGEYRVVEDELQLRLVSAVPFDSSTLFIEAWATSPAALWSYFRFVLLAGDASLDGYGSSGFTEIGELGFTFESDRSVLLTVALDDLDLAEDSLTLGFGAGWCGPPTYYCDHFPDGWGYPYDTFSPGGWIELSW